MSVDQQRNRRPPSPPPPPPAGWLPMSTTRCGSGVYARPTDRPVSVRPDSSVVRPRSQPVVVVVVVAVVVAVVVSVGSMCSSRSHSDMSRKREHAHTGRFSTASATMRRPSSNRPERCTSIMTAEAWSGSVERTTSDKPNAKTEFAKNMTSKRIETNWS